MICCFWLCHLILSNTISLYIRCLLVSLYELWFISMYNYICHTDKVGTPTIEVTPNRTTFTAGSFVILSCNANGYPSPLIDNHINYLLWTFTPHGKSDDVILISNNGLLSLENLQHKDSGKYTCTAHNGFNGKAFSSTNHVDLSIPPGKTENKNTQFTLKNVILISGFFL